MRKKDKWFSLEDLKDDKALVRSLQRDLEDFQNRKKGKKKKTTKASASIVPVMKDTRKYAETSTLLSDLRQCEALLNKASQILGERAVSYDAVALILSAAYAQPSTQKMKSVLSIGRKAASSIAKSMASKEKARLSLRAKGLSSSAVRAGLKKYPRPDTTPILEAIQEASLIIAHERSRLSGTLYTKMTDNINIDLSEYNAGDAAVMARADLTIGVNYPLDLAEIKRGHPKLVISHMESFLYRLENALLVGYYPHALPGHSTQESLHASVAHEFGVVANPVTTKLVHQTCSRVWFFIPEFKLSPRYVGFSDKAMTTEFGGLRDLQTNPTNDEIKFVFLRAGYPRDDLEALIKECDAIPSQRDKSQHVHDAYQRFVRRKKTEGLRDQRAAFLEENNSLIVRIRLLEDDVATYRELTAKFRTEFSILCSPTADAVDGLHIKNYGKIHEVFNSLKRSAVRGVRSSSTRIKKREVLNTDRAKARVLYWTYVELSDGAKRAREALKRAIAELERRRALANGEGLEDLDEVPLEETKTA